MGVTRHLLALLTVLFICVTKTSTDLALENKINNRRPVDPPQSASSLDDMLKVWSLRALETAAENIYDRNNIPEYKPIVRMVDDDGTLNDIHEEHVLENKYEGGKIQNSFDLVLDTNEASDMIGGFQSSNPVTSDSAKRLNLSDKIINLKNKADDTLNKLNLSLNQRVKQQSTTNTSNNVIGKEEDSSTIRKRNLWNFRNSNTQMACEIDVIQTSMTFSENIETSGGTITLICRGQVVVNKCEGMCSSSVTPDVNHYDGYLKQCSCCRDSNTRQRDVTLRSCFIGGAEVSGHFLTRTIVEPATCACLECRG